MTPELAMALDRANVSSRNATFIIAATLASLGINIEDVNLSHATIHRSRNKFRNKIAKGLKNDFQIDNRYVVHWDGKILSDIVGNKTVDRLPIVLSIGNADQLLGVPKMDNGTAMNQASVIIDTLNQWNLSSHVKAMCFDTTAVNTGIRNGTCAILERTFGRELIYLPCRHHIFEIILKTVFEIYWPTQSGPNVSIFLRFKNHWDNVDQSKFKSGMVDENVANVVAEKRQDLLIFIDNHLQVAHCRNDYKELLELSSIFLGSNLVHTFKRPGAMHHARWMAKAIYSLKIFMFRDEFKLTIRETNGLREVCIFVILFYIKAWFTATSANFELIFHELLKPLKIINSENHEKVKHTPDCREIS